MTDPSFNDPATIYRVDRTVARVVLASGDGERNLSYWLAKTPQERLSALEFLRSQMYGTDADNPPRLQRTYRIVPFPSS